VTIVVMIYASINVFRFAFVLASSKVRKKINLIVSDNVHILQTIVIFTHKKTNIYVVFPIECLQCGACSTSVYGEDVQVSMILRKKRPNAPPPLI
jgi:hypothetical protein